MSLAGKTYRAIKNSGNGTLNTETTMTFLSEGEAILGEYQGGTILKGNVVAKRLNESSVEMLYQCVTANCELKAGRAFATFNGAAEESMHLDWQWLTGDQSKGESDWILVG